MPSEEQKPFHEVVGLEASVGSKFPAEEDFQPARNGNGYRGLLQGSIPAWCAEPGREGDVGKIEKVMKDGNRVIIVWVTDYTCSMTQQVFETTEDVIQIKAEFPKIWAAINGLRHDVDNHENRLPPK